MVIDRYETALQDLMKDHESRSYAAPIVFSGSNLIFSTYQKIIAPYVSYISGYAGIVREEFAKQIPYSVDLQTMSDDFFKYEKEVKRVIQVFEQDLQTAALHYFYEQLQGNMVQVCYLIVQHFSNQLTYISKDLDSVFVAYKLAWAPQTQNMNLVLVPQGSDFATSITQMMTTLYVAAIADRSNSLITASQNEASKKTILQEMEKYHNILYQVYLNNGQKDQAARELLAIKGLKSQQKQAENAPKLFQAAQKMLQSARVKIVLDVAQPEQIKTQVIASISQLKQVLTSYDSAATAYEAAQDGTGYNKCIQAQNSINDIDMQLRMLQLVWDLFLIGPTASKQPTFSTVQSFLQTKSSVATKDAVQALQNLADLCQSAPNSLSPALALLPLLEGVMTGVANNNASNVSMALLTDAKEAIETLSQLLKFIIQAIASKDQKDIKSAMTYASHLDSLFEKNENIGQYVAFLPDILAKGSNPGFAGQVTWIQFSAQFLMRSGVVSTVAAAIAQVGKYEQPPTVELSVGQIKDLQAQGESDLEQAITAKKTGDFTTAAKQYKNMQNVYLKLLSAPSVTPADEQNIRRKYFLATTLFTASSLVSTISTVAAQSLGALTNVPTSYVVSAYQTPTIDINLLGLNALPESLQSVAPSKLVSTLSAAQKKDVMQIFKAYLVSQVVADQSVQFSDCFIDYQLKTVANISEVNQSIAMQALQQVNDYLKGFKTSSQMAVQVTSSTPSSSSSLGSPVGRSLGVDLIQGSSNETSLIIIMYKAPINAVTPLYNSAPLAADYFLGAQMLFQPGSQLISLAGSNYVPGNDIRAASMMLEDVAYCYASAAQQEIDQAQIIMAQILKKIGANVVEKTVVTKTADAKTVAAQAKGVAHNGVTPNGVTHNGVTTVQLPEDFTTMYSQVKKGVLRAQSLLAAQGQSAQAYFKQAESMVKAQAVQEVYIGLYQTLITFMKQCLVGDPFSVEYNNLLSDINTAYLQWGVELDQVKDAAQIAKINKDIVDLFVAAGNQCLSAHYMQSLFPKFQQIHYMAAAQDFIAAQKKYTAMGDGTNAAAMQDHINNAYFLGCDQNIELYFSVKNNGISYTSHSGQATNVSFSQLLQDYQSFEQNGALIDPAEQDGYNSVQNLLLNAAMIYQQLAQNFEKLVVVPAAQPASKKANTSDNQKLLTYLKLKNLIPQSTVTIASIPFAQVGLKEKILLSAPDIYQNFLSDPGSMVAWFNLLITIVQNIYMEDYLGATATETSTDLETKTKEFFDAEQKEASSLQNPSSAYVG
jgi:hypothetical protein